MRRTRRQIQELKGEILKLADLDYTYKEIAKELKIKSHQLVAYHLKKVGKYKEN